MAVFGRDDKATIRTHRFDTICYLIAENEPCLSFARSHPRHVRRRKLRYAPVRRLPRRPKASWLAAVLHCPGDDIALLARWAQRLPLAELDRIIVYEDQDYPDLTAARALRPWRAAGLRAPVRQRGNGPSELTRLLGIDLNWRILDDHSDRLA